MWCLVNHIVMVLLSSSWLFCLSLLCWLPLLFSTMFHSFCINIIMLGCSIVILVKARTTFSRFSLLWISSMAPGSLFYGSSCQKRHLQVFEKWSYSRAITLWRNSEPDIVMKRQRNVRQIPAYICFLSLQVKFCLPTCNSVDQKYPRHTTICLAIDAQRW